jgi:tagatose 1,6-diphosphate aldolase
VDVLKVEVLVNMRYVAGSRANTDGQVACSRAEAMAHFGGKQNIEVVDLPA